MYKVRDWISLLIVFSLIYLSVAAALAQENEVPEQALAQQAYLPLIHSINTAVVEESEAEEPITVDWTDQIIVRYRDAVQAAAVDRVAQVADLSAAVGVDLAFGREMSGEALVLRLPSLITEAEATAIAELIAGQPEIEYAVPDRRVFPLLAPNDTRYNEQWHYFAPTTGTYGANLPGAWDITTGASNLVVAVIDTGIRPHADLAGRVVPGYDFISNIPTANDGNGRDADANDPGDWITANESSSGTFVGCPVRNSSWHGTHVAGTIGAASNNALGVAGVNWNSRIQPVRVLGKCGGFTSDVVDGMRWAAGLTVPGVPNNPTPARVLNLSLGSSSGPCDAIYQVAIHEIVNVGGLVVVAAGNSTADVFNTTPASCSEVITVVATNRAGNRAVYSNFGNLVEISAPGGETSPTTANGVLSTLNSGTTTPGADTYATRQGTSMAAPHVAGLVSLMLSVNPSLTTARAVHHLRQTATAFPAGSTCTTTTCGGGIINAAGAVNAARTGAGGTPPGALNKLAPAADSTVLTPPLPTLSWSSSANAAGYEYCLQLATGIGCLNQWVDVGSATSVTLSNLQNGQTYLWQVRAYNNSGTVSADGGSWWRFTVQPAGPPTAFAKVAATIGSANSLPTISFSWTSSTNVTRYELCIDNTNDNACTNAGWFIVGNTTTTPYYSHVYTGVPHYWQVRAVNLNGIVEADSGVWWPVPQPTGPVPGAFNKSAPANGRTGERATGVTLRWGTSSAATSYEYCLDTTNNNSCDGSWVNNGTSTQRTVSGLQTRATYYWQVRARNSNGTTTANGGTWWSFATR